VLERERDNVHQLAESSEGREGTAEGADHGSLVSCGRGGVASKWLIEQSNYASGEGASHGMQGFAQMWMECRMSRARQRAVYVYRLQKTIMEKADSFMPALVVRGENNRSGILSVASGAALFQEEVLTSAPQDKTRARYHALWRGFVT
jgi:hypothetical protein